MSLVTHAIKALLTRDEGVALPAPYQRIFDACRSLVCLGGRGESLFERLKIELEKSVSTLAKQLLEQSLENVSVPWIIKLVEICAWFEKEVVSLTFLYCSARIRG